MIKRLIPSVFLLLGMMFLIFGLNIKSIIYTVITFAGAVVLTLALTLVEYGIRLTLGEKEE